MLNELIRLIKDVIGVRPLMPIILILLIGLAFKTVRDYPVKELFYDRYFLLISLAIVFASLAYLIWTSTLAERTAEGRYGIYVARIKGDPNRFIQTRLLEGLAANLSGKANDTKIRLEVKDLKEEYEDKDFETGGEEKAAALNATVIVWGTAVDEKTFYPRLWSQQGGLARSSTPVNVAEISPLAEFTAQAWERVEGVSQRHAGKERTTSPVELAREIEALRAELAELRNQIAAGIPASIHSTQRITEKLSALLIGIADYGGQANLAGPLNDVRALSAALKSRHRLWKVSTLTDRQATKKAIEEKIKMLASSLPPEETLLVYFSGHLDPDEHNIYRFYLSDMTMSIDVHQIITQTLKAHPRTLFFIDGRFDPSSLAPDLMKQAAVLTAEAQGMAYESFDTKKAQGAFTVALVDSISKAPPNQALAVAEIFRFVDFKLKKEYERVQPRMLTGSDPPSL